MAMGGSPLTYGTLLHICCEATYPHVRPTLRSFIIRLSPHHVFLSDDLVVVLSLHARHHEAHKGMQCSAGW